MAFSGRLALNWKFLPANYVHLQDLDVQDCVLKRGSKKQCSEVLLNLELAAIRVIFCTRIYSVSSTVLILHRATTSPVSEREREIGQAETPISLSKIKCLNI